MYRLYVWDYSDVSFPTLLALHESDRKSVLKPMGDRYQIMWPDTKVEIVKMKACF